MIHLVGAGSHFAPQGLGTNRMCLLSIFYLVESKFETFVMKNRIWVGELG